jgi:hypothetical protein
MITYSYIKQYCAYYAHYCGIQDLALYDPEVVLDALYNVSVFKGSHYNVVRELFEYGKVLEDYGRSHEFSLDCMRILQKCYLDSLMSRNLNHRIVYYCMGPSPLNFYSVSNIDIPTNLSWRERVAWATWLLMMSELKVISIGRWSGMSFTLSIDVDIQENVAYCCPRVAGILSPISDVVSASLYAFIHGKDGRVDDNEFYSVSNTFVGVDHPSYVVVNQQDVFEMVNSVLLENNVHFLEYNENDDYGIVMGDPSNGKFSCITSKSRCSIRWAARMLFQNSIRAFENKYHEFLKVISNEALHALNGMFVGMPVLSQLFDILDRLDGGCVLYRNEFILENGIDLYDYVLKYFRVTDFSGYVVRISECLLMALTDPNIGNDDLSGVVEDSPAEIVYRACVDVINSAWPIQLTQLENDGRNVAQTAFASWILPHDSEVYRKACGGDSKSLARLAQFLIHQSTRFKCSMIKIFRYYPAEDVFTSKYRVKQMMRRIRFVDRGIRYLSYHLIGSGRLPVEIVRLIFIHYVRLVTTDCVIGYHGGCEDDLLIDYSPRVFGSLVLSESRDYLH